ncbi:von Willebrand factor type A domain-containing protein [Auriculariales sp. MPI-PUGE-AT-0066]|nr:von Willebrand factor type A domain-containing protein [Auriculariales sp. MPI-PUGE-AT-0066]
MSLTLVPRFAAAPIPSQEYIFLVDRSGSMSGGRIRAVRDALQIMVRSLPSKGSTFNIFSFGDRYDSLWKTSVEYNKETVEAAAKHIDRMEANYNGTEIARALSGVFKSRKTASGQPSKEPAVLFVLTDGEAWDVQKVFTCVAHAVVSSHNALRVFVLGIGNEVSTEMCDGIARAGRGLATYVREQEKPDAKLVGLLRNARSALVDNISIDWGVSAEEEEDFEMIDATDTLSAVPDLSTSMTAPPTSLSLFDDSVSGMANAASLGPQDIEVVLPPPPRLQQAPSRDDKLPPLYAGARCTFFALVRTVQGAPLPQTVQVRGSMNGTPVTLDVPVKAAPAELKPKDGAIPYIHTLAARALIQDLEDSAGLVPLSAVTKAKIVRLATTHGLASSQTSFVAIDERSIDDVDNHDSAASANGADLGGVEVADDPHGASSRRDRDRRRQREDEDTPPPPIAPPRGQGQGYRGGRGSRAQLPIGHTHAAYGSGAPETLPGAAYSPTSPRYSPTSPSYSPKSPQFSSPIPLWATPHSSDTPYDSATPYASASPSFAPVSPGYSPTSPGFASSIHSAYSFKSNVSVKRRARSSRFLDVEAVSTTTTKTKTTWRKAIQAPIIPLQDALLRPHLLVLRII